VPLFEQLQCCHIDVLLLQQRDVLLQSYAAQQLRNRNVQVLLPGRNSKARGRLPLLLLQQRQLLLRLLPLQPLLMQDWLLG
jgi:hypothetical protein